MPENVKLVHKESGRLFIPAMDARVKNRDYFHLKNLYITLHELLVEEGWVTAKDPDFPEIFYLHRETVKSGNEIWIFWRPEKEINAYYKYIMDIDWHMIAMTDAEVMHEGQKFKTNFGEAEIRINSRMELDYRRQWRTHWFLKNIHDLFKNRIFKKDIDAHKLELYRESYRFHEAVKTYMRLRTYLPEPELQEFFPPLGLGTVEKTGK